MAKNHFGGYLSNSWYTLGGKSCSQTRKSCFQEGNPVFKTGNPAVKKGIPAFKKGNPGFNKAKPRFNKARPRFNKAWGPPRSRSDSGIHFPRKYAKILQFYTVWEPPGVQKTIYRIKRMKAKWYTTGSSDPRFLTRLRSG